MHAITAGGWLGLDVGGANLKLADGAGFARSQPFALWKQPEGLASALTALLESAPPASSGKLAVTMTGELCDCFRTKADGVRAILDSVQTAAAGRLVRVYLCDGRLVEPADAGEQYQLAAASNWHALATFCCRFIGNAPGLLIDIGSTTTDIVPLGPAGPLTECRTDYERLRACELIYAGVQRTPLAAVVDGLPYRGDFCPVASELFATTADAYLLTGDLAEDPLDCDTADGRSPLNSPIASATC